MPCEMYLFSRITTKDGFQSEDLSQNDINYENYNKWREYCLDMLQQLSRILFDCCVLVFKWYDKSSYYMMLTSRHNKKNNFMSNAINILLVYTVFHVI